MELANIGRFGSRYTNAVLRIAKLIMEMSGTEDFYDLEIDGYNGFVVVKKWKRYRGAEGDEIDVVAKLMWKPGIGESARGYTSLKDIEKWLEAERDLHTEANLSLD